MEDQGLNPMELKTGVEYLEYILNSEGGIMWMHFEEAHRIESAGKDEAFDEGFQSGFKTAINMIQNEITKIDINFTENEQ